MRKVFIALLISTASALVALLAGGRAAAPVTGADRGAIASFVQAIEMKTYDLRVRLTAPRNPARRDIVLVTIDEDSIRKLEPVVGRWPWPRLVHAQLVNYLNRAPAKVVTFDVLFSERDRTSFTIDGEPWTGTESDQAFVDAVAKAGNVVIGADATREEARTPAAAGSGEIRRTASSAGPPAFFPPTFRLGGVVEQRPVITPPFDELAGAARALGHTFLALDADGPARRSVPFIRVGDRAIPSLAVATALLADGISPARVRLDGDDLVLGDARMPTLVSVATTTDGTRRPARRSLVRFTGAPIVPATQPYDEYSFYRLFYSEQQLLAGEKPLVDPAVFRDKIVLVGVTAAGLHDVFTVPWSAEAKMPGTAIHANVVDNILSGRFLVPAPASTTVLSIVLAALAVGVLGAFLNAWWITGGTAVVLGTLSGISVALFARGTWLPVVPGVLAAALAGSGGVAYQYFVEGREKRHMKRVFSRIVAPDVYAHLLADPSRTQLGGERRQMSVLFSDIRGFTTVSERGRPEDIVAQLNEYFTQMVDVVFRHHGTVDKFVGDMVMALFGAPVEDPEHADHAVKAALDMLTALDVLNERWAREGRPCLQIGIGVNSGEMVAGNVGSEQIMSYTVIGDSVNLGSRLESLNKQYGTTIIISEFTKERLRGQYHIGALGDVTVKGKTQPVAIFEVRRSDSVVRGESQ